MDTKHILKLLASIKGVYLKVTEFLITTYGLFSFTYNHIRTIHLFLRISIICAFLICPLLSFADYEAYGRWYGGVDGNGSEFSLNTTKFICVVICIIICLVAIWFLICFIIKYFKQLFYAFVIICWIFMGLLFCSRFFDGCNGKTSDSSSIQDGSSVSSPDNANCSSNQNETSNPATNTTNYYTPQTTPTPSPRICPNCDGKGYFVVTYSKYDIWAPNKPEKIKCETCNGTGIIQ